MSDIMLLGVLCMPPELWDGSALDVTQRYGRYMQAARRIEEDARELERLRAALTSAHGGFAMAYNAASKHLNDEVLLHCGHHEAKVAKALTPDIQENTMTTLTGRELQTLRNLGNDDAAAEIESLRAKVHTQALQILTLTGEVAGFAADAERYRKGAHGNVKGTQGELGMAWCDFSGHAGSVARVLWVTDAEVDAAIAASKVE